MNGTFWQKEAAEIKQYLEEQVGHDCPAEMYQQCDNLAARATQLLNTSEESTLSSDKLPFIHFDAAPVQLHLH